MKFIEGSKVGELTFVTYDKMTYPPKGRRAIFNCSCGKEGVLLFEIDVIKRIYLRCKRCLAKLKRENRSTYETWKTMVGHHPHEIEESWLDSFENFFRDMGVKPEGSIFFRKDKEKLYSLDNCGWGTRQDAMERPDDLIYPGAKINRLEVLKKSHSLGRRGWFWLCRCDCGNLTTVKQESIKTGNTKSCGCLSSEVTSKLLIVRNFKHGLSGTKVYHAYNAMLVRCYRRDYEHYDRYGGRGITVSEQWLESFEQFFSDMGHPPSSTHSLDRIDNNMGYSRENCRWATKKEQARNQSSNNIILFNNVEMTQAEFLEVTNIPRTFLRLNLKKGLSPDEIFTLYKK